MSITSINPATGETLETFQETAPADVDRILARAHATFLEWRHTPFGERGRPWSGDVRDRVLRGGRQVGEVRRGVGRMRLVRPGLRVVGGGNLDHRLSVPSGFVPRHPVPIGSAPPRAREPPHRRAGCPQARRRRR